MTETETTRREKTARKTYSCVECEGDILPKSVYVASSLLSGGHCRAIKRHVDCLAFADGLMDSLATDDGYRLFLAAGLRTRDVSGVVSTACAAYPAVMDRLLSAGLIKSQ